MSDRDVIAWARMLGDTWHQLFGDDSKAAYRFRRLADLAEKGAEPCDKCGSEEPTDRHLCAICAIIERPDRYEAPPDRAAEDWQPIATAPESTWDSERRGQRELLLSVDGSVRIGFREEGFSYVRNGEDSEKVDATHWRPLPAPPGGER